MEIVRCSLLLMVDDTVASFVMQCLKAKGLPLSNMHRRMVHTTTNTFLHKVKCVWCQHEVCTQMWIYLATTTSWHWCNLSALKHCCQASRLPVKLCRTCSQSQTFFGCLVWKLRRRFLPCHDPDWSQAACQGYLLKWASACP